MPATIDQLKKSPKVGPRTETYTLCLSGELRAELRRRDDVLFELQARTHRLRDKIELLEDQATQRRDVGAERDSPPRRHGARPTAQAELRNLKSDLQDLEQQVTDAAAACDDVYEQARGHEVELTLQGRPNGEWSNWCIEHPPRDGNRRDEVEFGSICNADALIEDLATYVAEISGQPVKAGDWDFVVTNSDAGDLKDVAKVVVRLHEQTSGDLGKSRTAWLADQRISPGSD